MQRKSRIEYPGKIVDGGRYVSNVGFVKNGGWHPLGKRNYKKAVERFFETLKAFRRPRLFHICFKGKSHQDHKVLLHLLINQLTRKNIPNQWFSCREIDTGEHLHIFIIADASKANPQSVLNTFSDQFLGENAKRKLIDVYINAPQHPMHNEKKYIKLPWLSSSRSISDDAIWRLRDALLWLTYLYKARGKPMDSSHQIFSASRPLRKKNAPTGQEPYPRVNQLS